MQPEPRGDYTYWRNKNRSNRLSNARHAGVDWPHNATRCNDAGEHRWHPVSFVFETQLLDSHGRVQVRQPDLTAGRCYLVCLGCHTHTYVATEWAGYYLGGPGDGHAGPDPVLSRFDTDDGDGKRGNGAGEKTADE